MPGFEPSVEPLELPPLPPQPGFGQIEQPLPEPEELPEVEPPESPAFEPVEPALLPFCTLDGLRVRSSPAIEEDNITDLLPKGSRVIWTGEQQQADDHTWYQVFIEPGQIGWVASEWLESGDCNQASSGGETPTIIDRPTDEYGYAGLDPDANTNHFGVDISSESGDNNIYAPYSGSVVAQDPCDACVDDAHPNGQREGEFNPEYNFGYGAMTVVEFAYSDLTAAERAALIEDGIELGEGESLYMMVSHIDPNQSMLADAATLNPQDIIASIGTSGISSGPHAHVEAAVNESGLSPIEGENVFTFWTDTVAERPASGEPWLRFDPSPLFDLDE